VVNSSPLTFLNGCVARLFVFTMGKRIALVVGGCVFVVVLMAVMMVQQASAVCSVPLTTGTGGGTSVLEHV